MGRKSMNIEDKKKIVSIRIPVEYMSFVEKLGNKSKYFENLLIEYFKKNK